MGFIFQLPLSIRGGHPCSLPGVPRPHQLDFLMQKVSDWTKLRISPTFLDPRRDWVVSCLYMLSQCCPCVFLDLVHRNVTNLAETFPRKLKEFPADRTGQFLYPSTLRSKQMALYPLTFSALVHQKIAIVLSYFDPLV